jgi:hypothetical protein
MQMDHNIVKIKWKKIASRLFDFVHLPCNSLINTDLQPTSCTESVLYLLHKARYNKYKNIVQLVGGKFVCIFYVITWTPYIWS